MMYKGIRFDIHHHISAVTGNVNVHHVAPRGSRLALHCAKRGKVILPQQTLRGALHARGVERLVKMRDAMTQYRRTQAMIIDDVTIAARRGAEPGMKIRRYMFDPTHRDVTR